MRGWVGGRAGGMGGQVGVPAAVVEHDQAAPLAMLNCPHLIRPTPTKGAHLRHKGVCLPQDLRHPAVCVLPCRNQLAALLQQRRKAVLDAHADLRKAAPPPGLAQRGTPLPRSHQLCIHQLLQLDHLQAGRGARGGCRQGSSERVRMGGHI